MSRENDVYSSLSILDSVNADSSFLKVSNQHSLNIVSIIIEQIFLTSSLKNFKSLFLKNGAHCFTAEANHWSITGTLFNANVRKDGLFLAISQLNPQRFSMVGGAPNFALNLLSRSTKQLHPLGKHLFKVTYPSPTDLGGRAKIDLNSYFHNFCGASKGLIRALKGFTKLKEE